MKTRTVAVFALLCTSGVAGMTQTAESGGFKVIQGGPPIGEAGAGSAAGSRDASTAWFNPAAMTLVCPDTVTVATSLIMPSGHYRDEGSTNALGGPLGGDTDVRTGVSAFLPNLYFVHAIGERARIGLTLTSPFGLSNDYPDDWVGRYHATKSSMSSVDIGLAAAYRVDHRWSVGAGVDVQYLEARLDNAIDFGLIGLQALGPAGAAAVGLAPGQDDGSVSVRGSDWSAGWNAGVLFEPCAETRIGLTWRSSVEHRLEGRADFDVPADAAPLLAGGAFQDTGVRSKIELPETLSLGFTRDFGRRWTLLAGVEWTRWSRFEELRMRFDNPNQSDSVQPERWEDAWRFALGLQFRPDDRWTLRAGAAFDQSPVPSDTRTPRLPDADRLWTAVGVSCRVAGGVSVDLSWLHEFVEDAKIRQTDFPVRGNLLGTTESSVDYLSLSVSIDL